MKAAVWVGAFVVLVVGFALESGEGRGVENSEVRGTTESLLSSTGVEVKHEWELRVSLNQSGYEHLVRFIDNSENRSDVYFEGYRSGKFPCRDEINPSKSRFIQKGEKLKWQRSFRLDRKELEEKGLAYTLSKFSKFELKDSVAPVLRTFFAQSYRIVDKVYEDRLDEAGAAGAVQLAQEMQSADALKGLIPESGCGHLLPVAQMTKLRSTLVLPGLEETEVTLGKSSFVGPLGKSVTLYELETELSASAQMDPNDSQSDQKHLTKKIFEALNAQGLNGAHLSVDQVDPYQWALSRYQKVVK